MRRFDVACVALLFVAATATAQTTSPPPAAAGAPAVRDYGAGFRQMQALGLPDVKGAEYCAISAFGPFNAYSGVSRFKLKGSGWVLPGPTGATVRAVVRSGAVSTLWRQAELAKLQMAEAKSNAARRVAFMDSRIGATWKPVDLAADVDRLLKRVKGREAVKEDAGAAEAAAEGDEVAEASTGLAAARDWEIESSAGEIFLFAAMVYSHGLTNEANQLCQQLFDRFGGSRKIVSAGIDKLAQELLQQAKDDFETSGDWKAYADAVDGIATRFARPWPKAPAARLIASRLRARAEGQVAPLAPDGASEADRQLLRELAEKGIQGQAQGGIPMMALMNSDSWIMQPIPLTTNSTAAERLLARGVDAIPLLIALVPDPTPLPPERSVMGRHSYSYSYSSSSSDEEVDYSDEQVLEEAAASLPGPMTLGSWARGLLAPVVKDKDSNSYEFMRMSAADLQEHARAWYAANQGRSPLDLARAALKSEDDSERQAALNQLVKSTNVEDRALVDQALLESKADDAYSTLSVLQVVARMRGSSASGLVERVLASLQAKMKEGAAGGGNEARQAAQMQTWLTNQMAGVRAMVSGKKVSFEDAIREWVAQDKAEVWSMSAAVGIQESMAAMAPRDLVATVLRLAVATNGPARGRIVSLTQWADTMSQRQGFQELEMPGAAEAPTNRATATDFAEQWRILLNDPSANPDPAYGYYTNIASLATMSYIGLFDEDFEERGPSMGAAFDPAFLAVLHSRALALLDGKTGDDLPELPSAEQVPDARRSELRKTLLGLAADKRHAFVTGLAASERLWLFEATQEDEAMRVALLPETTIIRAVRAEKLPALAAKLAPVAQDRPISRTVLDACLDAVSNREARVIMLTPGDMMRGATLLASADEKGAPQMDWATSMTRGAPPMTGVVAVTYIGSDMVRAFWPIGQPVEVPQAAVKPKPATAEDEEDELAVDVSSDRYGMTALKADPAAQSNFWKRVTAQLAAKPSAEDEDEGEGSAFRFFIFSFHDPSSTNEVDESYSRGWIE